MWFLFVVVFMLFTVSPRGHLFYVDFLFLIFTSHRGGNVSTSVEILLTAMGMFPPRWKYFSPRWECFHRGGNVLTAVGMFPRWKHSHRGENIPTAVGMFPPRWKYFSTSNKCSLGDTVQITHLI